MDLAIDRVIDHIEQFQLTDDVPGCSAAPDRFIEAVGGIDDGIFPQRLTPHCRLSGVSELISLSLVPGTCTHDKKKKR
jgi:hypothetical protein